MQENGQWNNDAPCKVEILVVSYLVKWSSTLWKMWTVVRIPKFQHLVVKIL